MKVYVYSLFLFLYAWNSNGIHQNKLKEQLLFLPGNWCVPMQWVKENLCFGVCIFSLCLSRDRLHCGFTWVSKEKGCSPPLASKSSVLSISDSWSPPPSARPRSPQSPHSAGPPVRITSHLWIFHYMFFSKSASKLGTSSAHSLFLNLYGFCLKCYMHHPPLERISSHFMHVKKHDQLFFFLNHVLQ